MLHACVSILGLLDYSCHHTTVSGLVITSFSLRHPKIGGKMCNKFFLLMFLWTILRVKSCQGHLFSVKTSTCDVCVG